LVGKSVKFSKKNACLTLLLSTYALGASSCSGNTVNTSVNSPTGNGSGNVVDTSTTIVGPGNRTAKDISFRCLEEGKGEATVLLGKIGSKERGLTRYKTGVSYFGKDYPTPQRCNENLSKTTHALKQGATGWLATKKNEYPIICASKDKRTCMRKDDGSMLEVSTFPKGVNIEAIASQFGDLMRNGAVSSGVEMLENSSPSLYMDFRQAIIGD
jgi:hypothetical protein